MVGLPFVVRRAPVSMWSPQGPGLVRGSNFDGKVGVAAVEGIVGLGPQENVFLTMH